MQGTPSDVLRHAEGYLGRHGIESPRRTAEVLLAFVLGTDRASLYSRRDGLSAAEAELFRRAVYRRCAGTPVQHLTGRQAFRHLDLEVRPGVFIPRPETEVVVGAALDELDQATGGLPVVIDVGTGTGAIALSVKRERPGALVHATDLSPDAVRLARANALRLGLDVAVHQGDLLDPLPIDLRGRVSVIVSNPPYLDRGDYAELRPEVRADPELALVGGTAVHGRLVERAPEWLGPGGSLVMEIGAEQGPDVTALLHGNFATVQVVADLSGRDRVVLGRLPERPGA
jgi:release factor glutamine methyltransferase